MKTRTPKISRSKPLLLRALLAVLCAATLLAAACTEEPKDEGMKRLGEAPQQGSAAQPATEISDLDPEKTTIYRIHPVDAQTVYVVGTSDDGYNSVILKTTDGGATWVSVLQTEVDEIVGIGFVDAQNGRALSDDGGIFSTSDGGQTWSSEAVLNLQLKPVYAPEGRVGTASPVFAITLFEGVTFVDETNGWVFGGIEVPSGATKEGEVRKGGPFVLRTTDGGKTWTETRIETDTGVDVLRRGYFLDAQNGWAIGGDPDEDDQGLVVRTSDGGKTWQPVTIKSRQFPMDIFFLDQNRGWIVGYTEDEAGGDGPSEIFATTDGGKTWKAQVGVPVSLRSIRFVDAMTGWAVGGRSAIYHTTDGGATWAVQAEQNWALGTVLDVPEQEGIPASQRPTFTGFALRGLDHGWASSDMGVYEYRKQ